MSSGRYRAAIVGDLQKQGYSLQPDDAEIDHELETNPIDSLTRFVLPFYGTLAGDDPWKEPAILENLDEEQLPWFHHFRLQETFSLDELSHWDMTNEDDTVPMDVTLYARIYFVPVHKRPPGRFLALLSTGEVCDCEMKQGQIVHSSTKCPVTIEFDKEEPPMRVTLGNVFIVTRQ